jgi:hypothetical protein
LDLISHDILKISSLMRNYQYMLKVLAVTNPAAALIVVGVAVASWVVLKPVFQKLAGSPEPVSTLEEEQNMAR